MTVRPRQLAKRHRRRHVYCTEKGLLVDPKMLRLLRSRRREARSPPIFATVGAAIAAGGCGWSLRLGRAVAVRRGLSASIQNASEKSEKKIGRERAPRATGKFRFADGCALLAASAAVCSFPIWPAKREVSTGIKMAVSGTLAVKVHRLEAAEGGEPGAKYSIRVAVGDDARDTSYHSIDHEIDESLHYDVQAAAESEEVTIEVLQQHQAKALVSTKRTLREFMEGFHHNKMTFTFGSTSAPQRMELTYSADWTQTKTPQATTLAAADTHRPWFMRASYYYETSKNVYDYTTSFRVVKPFARLGEATVNTVLATVTGKTLFDVDQSLVVPVLDSVDNKVDATISVAFTKLYEGQRMVVRTKDKAVRAVSSVARGTGNTAVRATNYTTHKVASATGAVYGAVTGVADYTSSQVVHASSSTYGVVRGVTYSVASHIPILGPKIRA